MIIKVDKILLDSLLAAGMIGDVRLADPVLVRDTKSATTNAMSNAQAGCRSAC